MKLILVLLFCGVLRAASSRYDFDACVFDQDPYVGLKADPNWPDTALPDLVGSNDFGHIRAHAWRLLEKFTANYGRDSNGHRIPVWQTWYAYPEISSGGKQRMPGAIADFGESTFFNRNLCAEIRKAHLYCTSSLNMLKKSLPPGDTRDVPINDVRDAVVKAAWKQMKNGAACVGRWDREGSTSGLNKSFRRNVCVLADGKTAKECLASGCPVSPDNPAVSANRFYSVPQDGDRYLLTGLHFVTRETDQWIWGTAWWHPKPNVGPFAAGRTSGVRGPWRNYLVDVAYDMDNPRATDGGPSIVYNPFLEGGLTGGTRSNCVTCHRRAVYPLTLKDFHTLDDTMPTPLEYINVRGSEAAVRTYIPDFAELLKLHFIWHPALRQDSAGVGCQAGGS